MDTTKFRAALHRADRAAEDLARQAHIVSTYLDVETPAWIRKIIASAEQAGNEFRHVMERIESEEI